jgi:pathogenesis-related protein 1
MRSSFPTAGLSLLAFLTLGGCDSTSEDLGQGVAVVPADASSVEDSGVRLMNPDSGAPRPIEAGTPDAPAPLGGQGEPAELAGITLAHNRARLAENAGLPQLTWDPALAAIAAAWAAKCQDTDAPKGLIDHNPNRSAGYPTYVGENIYGGSDPLSAVDLWMAEKANYNLAANSCSGVCGHYTQVVWRQTTKLGCAIATCPTLQYSPAVVCDYGPGGNVGGQRPY